MTDTAERLAWLAAAEGDVREAGRIQTLETIEGEPPSIVVVLGEPDPA